MKIYTLTEQFENEQGSLDYSVITGVFTDKEEAKATANRRLKDQANFWPGYFTTKKQSKGYCKVTLVGGKDKIKHYILQEHDAQ